jgi:predicted nicotinamide N-methyase
MPHLNLFQARSCTKYQAVFIPTLLINKIPASSALPVTHQETRKDKTLTDTLQDIVLASDLAFVSLMASKSFEFLRALW